MNECPCKQIWTHYEINCGTTHTHNESDHILKEIIEFDDVGLKTFHYTKHTLHDIEKYIDPENSFLLNINNCHYYAEERFNQTFGTQNKISIIH